MAFSLILVPSVKSYLADLRDFTRGERTRLFTGLNEQLRLVPDAFRADPDNRREGAPHFVWTFVLRRDAGGYSLFRFFVDDSAAGYGVLSVVYADYV